MGLFTKLSRIFRGKSSDVEKKLVQTEAYWKGLEADIDKKVGEVSDRFKKAKAVLDVKIEKRNKFQALVEEMSATAIESRERYKETKDEFHKTNSMNAFNKMNEHKTTLDVLNAEIDQLQTLVSELELMKSNANEIAKNKKAEIIKAKSRVQFSDTMKGLTDGIKEFTTMELEGAEEVDITYHENMANLKELNGGVVRPVHRTSDFDNFFNEGGNETV